MKALILNDRHSLQLVDKTKPSIESASEAIFQVAYTGICGTDRSVLVGKFPANTGVVMGHESVGVVAEAGEEASVAVGDRVLLNPTLYCGWCPRCRLGNQNFCINKRGTEVGLDMDGTYAEYMKVDSRYLHIIPDSMTFERAVLIDPLACALNNVERAQVSCNDRVLIIGGGPIGALCAMVVLIKGAEVTLVETSDVRREMVSDFLSGVSVRKANVVAELCTSSDVYSVAIDTVGSCLTECVSKLDVGGRAVLMGYNSNVQTALRNIDIVTNAWSIMGAGDFTPAIFENALSLSSSLPLEKLVTHVFPLESYEEAFALLGMGQGNGNYNAMKVLLRS